MKIGIMQPYFFPYIGYWQLLKLTDRYIIYDDVNFIKGGWINRNRILINGQGAYINVPMRGASPNKKINEVETDISKIFLEKTGRKLKGAYAKAPYFQEVFPWVMETMDFPAEKLSQYLTHLIRKTAERLKINTEFIVSSDYSYDVQLHGEDRVLALCGRFQGDVYYNAIGGKKLYSFDHFRENNLKLCFVESAEITYRQFGNPFVPNLSIIDVLMFNGWEKTKEYLDMVRIYQEERNSDGT